MNIMGKLNAFVTAPFDDEALKPLKKRLNITFGGWRETRRRITPEELKRELEGVQILLVELDPVSRGVIEESSELRLIASCRGNPRISCDVEAATEKGIPVISAPGRNVVSVAESTIGFMLMLGHRLVEARDELKRRRKWGRGQDYPYIKFQGIELQKKTVGIIGFGRVGKEVAKRLRCFDVEILVYDPFISERPIRRWAGKKTDLDTLLQSSDFVTIHTPLAPETKHIIGKRELQVMKPTAYLVNTARGVPVDEKALYDHLKQRRIRGAAFDVVENEPLEEDHPFLSLDNMLVTPHITAASVDTIRHYSFPISKDIQRWLKGLKPKNVFNPEVYG